MSFINYQLPSMPSDLHAGSNGLERVYQLLNDLGDPQNTHPVIHIAGTSGKGTTAYMIDNLLRKHGLRTGLTVSPYVYDMRERWYVNGDFLEQSEILAFANKLLPALQNAEKAGRIVSRFEAIICLAFLIMAGQKIDYFVLETGMGGLLDPTNTISRTDKIVALTTIGLDHTHILGNDLVGIASHKAGIIQVGNTVFATSQAQDINMAFSAAAGQKDTKVRFVEEMSQTTDQVERGRGFARNASLSLAVVKQVLADKQIAMQPDSLQVLNELEVPGRGEQMQVGHTRFILDGAHNTQKITALVSDIKARHLDASIGAVVVIAKSQQMAEIIDRLATVVDRFIFVDYPDDVVDFKEAVNPQQAVKYALENGLKAQMASYEGAVQESLDSSRQIWLVTGSFYHLQPIKELLLSNKS